MSSTLSLLRGLLLLGATATVAAAAASVAPSKSAPFTPAQASAHACPKACQTSLLKGIKEDRETFSPSPIRDESFYETAANFSKSKPGDILKFQPITKLASYDFTTGMPPGVTLYALQYTSVGLNDTKVPVTGVIALPFTINDSAEPQRFPLISYAHGTSGYLPPCAITHSPNFYDYYTWAVLTLAGYAVVGTDYAGLGNNATRHVYNAPTIQSNDVFYAAIAAKKALPNLLTTKWAAAGHSQGGGAAYALTENTLIKGRDDFVGAVAISPSARLYDVVIDAVSGSKATDDNSTSMSTRSSSSNGAYTYLPFLIWAAQVAEPSIHISKALSQTFLKRFNFGNQLQVCSSGIYGLFSGLKLGQFFSSSGISTFLKFIQKYQKDFGAGLGKPAYAPLLIVQSTGDQTVGYKSVEKAYQASCNAGNEVKLNLIPYLDHSATPAATAPIWVSWLRARFSEAKHVKANCSSVKIGGVDLPAAFAPHDF